MVTLPPPLNGHLTTSLIWSTYQFACFIYVALDNTTSCFLLSYGSERWMSPLQIHTPPLHHLPLAPPTPFQIFPRHTTLTSHTFKLPSLHKLLLYTHLHPHIHPHTTICMDALTELKCYTPRKEALLPVRFGILLIRAVMSAVIVENCCS